MVRMIFGNSACASLPAWKPQAVRRRPTNNLIQRPPANAHEHKEVALR
jgi:hypothetical protein